MISSKELSEDQVNQLKSWADDGAQLGDLQNKINEAFGLKATYLDTRFILLDLGIELIDPNAEAEPVEPSEDPITEEAPSLEASPVESESASGVRVTLDQITEPGMMYNGFVTFSDGVEARWFIDNTGRPGLKAENKEYQPSPEDIQTFQTELRNLLR